MPGKITGRARTIALVVVLLAAFMDLMDVTILNVTLPTIQASLHAGPVALEWMLSGYTLALTAGLISGARLRDLLGHKRVFVAGVAGFAAASAVCSPSDDPGMLVAARIVQGLFAAAMIPQVPSLLQLLYRAEERGPAMAAYSALSGIAATAGPVLGPALLGWNPGEVGCLEPDQVGLGDGVDGDQRNDEPRRRAAGAVEEPGDPVGGQRLRQPGGGGQGDTAGGVAEDDPFLAQRPEQAAQRDDAVRDHRAVPGVDRIQDVLAGHLAQRRVLACPSGEHGHQVGEVVPDGLVGQCRVGDAEAAGTLGGRSPPHGHRTRKDRR